MLFASARMLPASKAMISLGVATVTAAIVLTAHGQTIAQPMEKNCDTPTTPFCDALMKPIAGWSGHIFKLAQNYPSTAPTDAQPWRKLNPYTEPGQYLQSVLEYFYEGNIRSSVEDSFDPALNSVRGWYNAPWQDHGVNGREFVHGLTRERTSLSQELDPKQTLQWSNYAVGFYNAPGGVTIGKVWAKHGDPNPDLADMPEGTVAAKLLFTTAPVDQVPYLAGSPEWQAYVYTGVGDPRLHPLNIRSIQKVRLLQIDIAVKDSRAKETGWIFGTFIYGGGPGHASDPAVTGWRNVFPVGVMWGNDPDYPSTGQLKQTWLNPDVNMSHVGYQGRLNGPVDNPNSSCMSCHSTAELPQGQMVPSGSDDVARWFRNIPSGEPFDSGRKPLDYSLQLEVGLVNFLQTHPDIFPTSMPAAQVKQVHNDKNKPLSRAGVQ